MTTRAGKVAGIAVVAVLLGVPVAAGITKIAQSISGTGDQVILAAGSDRRPNETAEDWVTYADYVVVVSPTGQTEIPPSASEVERGEGLILRRLLLRVETVLWSKPNAERAAPSSFPWTAHGWQFKGDTSKRVEMAPADAPRLEPGHRYIMAITWEEERCTPGDYVPARWTGLGADSTVPFDDQRIANGEFEGRVRTSEQARAQVPAGDPNPSLEDRLVGRSAAALQQTLRATTPGVRQRFGPEPSSTQCS